MRGGAISFVFAGLSIVVACSDDASPSSSPSDAGAANDAPTSSDAAGDAGGLTGTVIATASPSAAGIWSSSIATDGAHVYWLEGGAVKRVAVGGGSVEEVATGQADPT